MVHYLGRKETKRSGTGCPLPRCPPGRLVLTFSKVRRIDVPPYQVRQVSLFRVEIVTTIPALPSPHNYVPQSSDTGVQHL